MVHRRAATAVGTDRAARRIRARAGLVVAVALLLAWPVQASVPWEEPKGGYTREHILELWKNRPQDPEASEGHPWRRFVVSGYSAETRARLLELAEEPSTRLMALSGLVGRSEAELFPFLKRTVERTDLVPEEAPLLVGLLARSEHPEAWSLAEAQWGRSPEWTQALLARAASGGWKKPGRERLESILWDVSQPSQSRIFAFAALSRGREVNGVELTRRAMSDVDPRLREHAVTRASGTESLAEAVLAALQDPDENVRGAAVKSLELNLHVEGEPARFDQAPHTPPVARAYALLTAMAERPGGAQRASISLLFRLANHAECHGELRRAERFYREVVARPFEYDPLAQSLEPHFRALAFAQFARLLVLTGRPVEVERLLERLEDMEYSGRALASDLPWMREYSGQPEALAHRVRRELHSPLRLSVEPLGKAPRVRITVRNVSREVQHLEMDGPERKNPVPRTVALLVDGARAHESWSSGEGASEEEPFLFALRPGQSLSFTRTYERPKERHGRARLDAIVELDAQGSDGELVRRKLQAVGTVVLP